VKRERHAAEREGLLGRREVSSYPGGEFGLGQAAVCKSDHGRQDVVIVRFDVFAIDREEGQHRHKGDAFVAVAIRVVASERKGVSGRQGRQVRSRFVGPLVAGARQRRPERSFVAEPE